MFVFLEVWGKSCYDKIIIQREEVSPTEKKGIKIAAQNRKAWHDYFVEEKYR